MPHGGLAGLAVAGLIFAACGQASTDEPDTASEATNTAAEPPPAETTPPTTTPEPTEPDDEDEATALWTVVRVIDGDTIEVGQNGTDETVRLVGIDAPERGECGYEEATATLQDLIGGEEVELVGAGSDTDNRESLRSSPAIRRSGRGGCRLRTDRIRHGNRPLRQPRRLRISSA